MFPAPPQPLLGLKLGVDFSPERHLAWWNRSDDHRREAVIVAGGCALGNLGSARTRD
jgi:hypothetical protein